MTDQIQINSLLSVIRKKCIDCSGGQVKEVDNCQLIPVYVKRTCVMGCPLWPYREGLPTKAEEQRIAKEKRAYEKLHPEAAAKAA